jgi:nitroreductase
MYSKEVPGMINEPAIDVIKRRISHRTFDPSRECDVELARLREYCDSQLSSSLFGNRVRLSFISARGRDVSSVPGTYGVIRRAPWFLAGTVTRGRGDLEDFGRLFEEVILAATSLGLGSCWVGGTFRKSSFAPEIEPADDEIFPAVTPLGIPAGSKSVVDRLIRAGAGSRRRKSFEELFFRQDGTPVEPGDLDEKMRTCLEMVRIAPSSSNTQPWRLYLGEGRVDFYLKRTPLYGKLVPGEDLQRIDMGIALCHFEQAARETGLPGGWKEREGSVPLEYITSWIGIE